MRQGSFFDNFYQVFGLVLEISLALSIQKWHRAQRSKVYVRKIILSKNQLKRTERAGVLQLLRLTSGQNFWEFSWKNDVSQIDPGPLWEGPGTIRASKNIKGMTKHPLGGVWKDVQKLTENLIIWRVLGPNLFKFPMLAHVLPGGGPLGRYP